MRLSQSLGGQGWGRQWQRCQGWWKPNPVTLSCCFCISPIIPWHQSLSHPISGHAGGGPESLHARKQGCGATTGVPGHVGRALHSQRRTARGLCSWLGISRWGCKKGRPTGTLMGSFAKIAAAGEVLEAVKGSKWRGLLVFFTFLAPPSPHFPSTVALQVPGVSGFSVEALGENAGRCRQLSLSGMLGTDKGQEALPAASGPSAGRATHPPQLLPGQATGLGVPSGPAGGKRPGGSFPLCPAILPRTELGAGHVLPRGPKWGVAWQHSCPGRKCYASR